MTAPAAKFREEQTSPSAIRNLVRCGALRPLRRGKKHSKRDVETASERVTDGLFELRAQQRAAGTPHRNFSDREAWNEWSRRHPHALAARAATASRLASRAAHRGQGDLFITSAGRAI